MAYKPQHRSLKRRRVLLPIILVLLVGVGLGIGYHYHNMKPVYTESNTKKAENAPNEARKGSSSPSTTLDNGSTAPNPSSSAAFTVQIVSSTVNSGNLHVGTMVGNTTAGTCSLTASQAGQTTLQLGSSTVKQDVNSYDCGVFNIPTSTFPASGVWKITLTVTNSGAQASDSASVTIPSS